MSHYDVLVLGGGIVGMCCAYYLSSQGIKVAIVDKGELGHGSSLRNAGYISPSHFIPLAAPGVFTQGLKWMLNPTSPLYIKPRYNKEFLQWSWHFARACREKQTYHSIPILRDILAESKKLYQELAQCEGMDFDLTREGLIILYHTEKGKKSCEHEAHLADKFQVEAELVNSEKLSALDPKIEFKAKGGLYFEGDLHLSPEKLLSNMITSLEKRGVPLIRNCTIENFEVKGNKLKGLNSNIGSFTADQFILACGAWSPLVARQLQLKMLLEAGKGYSVTIQNPAVKPKHPYILLEKRVAVTPFAHSLRFAGTMEIAGHNLDLNMPRINAILDALSYYYANIERPIAEKNTLWAGLRPVTPDGLPYIGRFKHMPNVIAATGHAMLGVSLAPVTGRIVCDLVQEKQSHVNLTSLSPDRYT